MSETIYFYRVSDDYGEFSNFSKHGIKLGGEWWPTTEHYFQAKKFEGSAHEKAVREAKTAGIAARMGRSRKRPLRKDWESVKERVMYEALEAKFTQHEELRELLLGTEDAWLVEHTAKDRYWGDGGDGTGKNRLGHLLMRLRGELERGE